MSRRNPRADKKSDKPERGRPPRRHAQPLPEVVLARRPRSPSPPLAANEASAEPAPTVETPVAMTVKRAARIVTRDAPLDEAELERRHLLSRLLESEGPSAITRAAKAYRQGGFSFPEEQPVLLKLLEHSDEGEVCHALEVLATLLDQQSPIKLPVFEQRLKRLEDSAENPETRSRAAELRRVLRT
ncbi:MAG TPA: hypothetical protein VNW92_08390 [Polyangiaceae bacterium]|jgi:hypothetical protein|nr:hypothetical protein [Polyangiaceae bacterium]